MKKTSAAAAIFLLWTAHYAGARSVSPIRQTGQADDGKVLLRLHLVPGQSFHTVYTTDASMAFSALGRLFQMENHAVISMENEVLGVSKDGSATVSSTITSINIASSQDGQRIAYSSLTPRADASPIGQYVGAFIGVPITITYGADGTAKKIVGLDALRSRIAKSLRAFPAVSLPGATVAMKQTYADHPSQALIANAIGLPRRAVRIGDSWSLKSSARPAGFQGSDRIVFTLQDRLQGVDLVSIGLGGAARRAVLATKSQGNSVSISFTCSGQREIDEATGWTTRGDIALSGTGKITVPDPSGEYDAISAPIAMTIKEHIVTTDLPGLDEQVEITPDDSSSAPRHQEPSPPDDGEVVVN